MRRYGIVLVTSIGFLLSGCMVGPRYVKPIVPVTPNFEETQDSIEGDGWKVAQPDDDLIRGKWWELYGDATLNEIEDQVDPSNQELKIAEANLRQARAAIRFNRASQAPTIGSSPSISDIRASANKPYFPSSSVNNGSGDFILPLDLSYEVDLWGRVRRSVAAAKQQTQASAADLQTARLSLHAEVAVDYFEVRSADAQERLLNDTVKAYRSVAVDPKSLRGRGSAEIGCRAGADAA
jgi:outer membrane protein TolC